MSELKFNQKKYLELQEQEDVYLNARRSDKGMKQVIYRTKSKKTPEVFENHQKYNFLQYIHMVYEWAEKTSGLTREEIDFLLYANPIGVFNKFQVQNMIKTTKMNRKVTLNRLIEKGAIKMCREKKGSQLELYKLTGKALHMCSSMHTMIAGERKISDNKRSPFHPPKRAQNQYYLNIIKEMNSKVGADSN